MERIILNPENEHVAKLIQSDQRLGQLITFLGTVYIPLREDPFLSLIKSIVGQQISVKAAQTIFTRVLQLVDELTPQSIYDLSEEELRQAGVSKSKITYMKSLAENVLSNDINFSVFPQLNNEEIIKLLTKTKGIGNWTAEMFLIFSLGRMDVLSVADAGLQRAVKWLYNLDRNLDGRKCMKEMSVHWNPYYSAASFYLWEAINRGYVDRFDTLEQARNRSSS
ncbi:DNA-3-methyladenine glycosylase family protein [Ammoniphilus resinae]|uniref:DNA-3-methyladenine glycosylase II n=1 Tax=Ammoniphilus resinae TaxID=861532 RepID=A0ABS4GM67_9BACL|nr:DNA-3-methyladenine glycosylase [Ammoniphilus resinae]MBP1931363.1 DNA-3-methyladenine glycosylase II [Ammoniphilus resinae]